jgi:uncharacterized cofD-like protein
LTALRLSGIVDNVQNNAKHGANGSVDNRWRRILRWLEPGLGVKRWLGIMILGTALIGLALAIMLLDIYRNYPDAPILAILSLRTLPRWMRAALLGLAGLAILLTAVFRLNRTLLAPYVRPGKPVVEAIAQHRRLGRGPKIVALGGGTGLATLLRGLKRHTGNLTAVVSVADDGGSSGRLRQSLGLPPPGDLRNCLAALSNDEDLLTQLFQYRFMQGEELNGHSFGNLLIAALAGVTGSFDEGITEVGKVLAIRGKVVPSTLGDVALVADKSPAKNAAAIRVKGESHIPDAPGQIRQVSLLPNDPPAYPGAIQAILNADMIVIGPGSLYTSVLPNLLVPRIVDAIRTSRAFKVYVCNVAVQSGETDGYNCPQHLQAIENHVGRGIVDIVVANDSSEGVPSEEITLVDAAVNEITQTPVYLAHLVDDEHPWRHDAEKLAEALIALLEERTGPLDLASENHSESSIKQ